MFPRGRMYSDQVGQWSPREYRNGHSERIRAPEAGSEGGETGRIYGPASGASHSMCYGVRGSRDCYRASDKARGRSTEPSSSEAGRKTSSPSSSRSSRRSSSQSPCYGLLRRLDSPGGGEQLESHSRTFEGRSPFRPGTSRCRPHRLPEFRGEQPEWHGRRRLRGNPTSMTGSGGVGSVGDCINVRSTLSPPPPPWGCRNRGGGMGIRGRGRPPFSSRGRFGGKRGPHSPSYSASVDFQEDHRRSRSRERARRRRQYETIQRYCRPGGTQQVCWDGFQWVRKADEREVMFDQTMNATRRARRLHIGNLPLLLDATEEELKQFLWESMRRKTRQYLRGECPVLHVWISKERGSNYGFVEMASVEDAQVAISLNPLVWKGQQLRINRPTDWKKDSAEVNFAEISGAANVALLESVAAAVAVVETTGDSSALAKLLSTLPETQRKVIADFLAKSPTGIAKQGHLPVELLQCQIQAELLHGQASRVVRITNPVPEAVTDEEMEETLSDVLEEVNKRKDVLAALIITKDLEQLLPAAEVGDIYVQFATGIQADICILSFAGRMYDGRPLVIERFNEMVWRQSMQKFAKSLLKDILSRFV